MAEVQDINAHYALCTWSITVCCIIWQAQRSGSYYVPKIMYQQLPTISIGGVLHLTTISSILIKPIQSQQETEGSNKPLNSP